MSQELITAINNNNLVEAKRLIGELTVDKLNTVADQGSMPLHLAVRNNNMDIVKDLIAKGVNLNAQDTSASNTPLHIAIEIGNLDMVKLLLANKVNIALPDSSKFTPLLKALNTGRPEVAKMLFDAGADVKVFDANNYSALHAAAAANNVELVKLFLSRGAGVNVNKPDSTGYMPVNHTISLDIAKALIDAGANLTSVNNAGISSILKAVMNNRPELVELYLAKGAKSQIDLASNTGENPLWNAANAGRLDIVKILVKNGANLNYQNPKQYNKTPLMVAILSGRDDICKELVMAGADLSLKESQGGKAALELAENAGLTNAIKWIKIGELANQIIAGTNITQIQENLQAPEAKAVFVERLINNFSKFGFSKPFSLDKYAKLLPEDLVREVHQKLAVVKYTPNPSLDSKFSREITEKIAEGNDRINSIEEEATIILGPTGSGKTTLGHVLSGMKLQAMRNDLNFRLVIDAVSPESPYHISHSKKSETTVPNKFTTDSKVKIWDCPGFNDTTPAQELANSFYIAKLFNGYSKIKFVFVVNEGDITNNRGVGFVNLVQQFCSGFNDVSMLENSVVFVVSAATPGKQAKHVQYEINEIISQNTALDNEVKSMMEYLSKSVKIFSQPTSEGLLDCTDLKKSIESTGSFVETDSMGKFNLSPKAQDYGIEFLKKSFHTFEQIVDIITEACKNPIAACKHGKDNIFTKNYELIKKWLPSNITYEPSIAIRDHTLGETYADVKHLMKLNSILKELHKVAKYEPAKLEGLTKVIERALNVFEEFVMISGNAKESAAELELKTQIKHFAYVSTQMKEFCQKFSSVVDPSKLPAFLDLHVLSDRLEFDMKKADSTVATIFQKSVVGLDIMQECTDISYFKEAIKLLNKEPSNPEVIKKKAAAFKCIGAIKKQDGRHEEALKYLAKAVELDKDLASAYELIGDILDGTGRFAEAAKFYKALGNTFKMKQCYKKLICKDPDNPKLHEECGDTLASFGDINTAVKYYTSANGFIRELQQKKAIATKIAKTMSAEFKASIEKLYQDRAAGTTKFYQFEQINVKDYFSITEESSLIGTVDLGIGIEH